MGGAVWTKPEEDYFWTIVVPNSDKKIGYDKDNDKDQVKSWPELARQMREHFTAERLKEGKEPLRGYSEQTLTERWHKAIMQDRRLEHGERYRQAYLAELERSGGIHWQRRQRLMNKRLGITTDDDGPGSSRKKQRTKGPEKEAKSARSASDDDADDEMGGLRSSASPKVNRSGGANRLPSMADLISDLRQQSSSPLPFRAVAQQRHVPGRLGSLPFTRPIDRNAGGMGGQAYVTRAELDHMVRDRVREAWSHRLVDVEALIRREVEAANIPELVREEVSRQLSQTIQPTELTAVERRASANVERDLTETARQALAVMGHNQSPAHGRRAGGYGHGGTYSFGSSPMGHYRAGNAYRTPLPPGRARLAPTQDQASVDRVEMDDEEGEDRA